jgi:hypothetical protein
MRELRESVYVFAGPTLAASPRARELARGLRVRPPVKRHDVQRLVDARAASHKAPGVLVLVDGLFHDTLAVGHAELRNALRAGWRVWGLSSMGAIRAREMGALGMQGFGRVFARFEAESDFQDDEVALLHGPAPEYRPLSEPLVHLRAAADHLATRGVIAEQAAREVIATLKSRWYGERSRRGAFDAFGARASGGTSAVRAALGDFRVCELKTLDLEEFLLKSPWTHTGGSHVSEEHEEHDGQAADERLDNREAPRRR